MKKLIVAAVLVVGFTTFAQVEKKGIAKKEPMEKITPAERSQRELKRITKDLGLNETQQKQMAELISEREAKRADGQFKPTKEDRKANKERISKILTPEQNEKWEKIQAERREKMQERKAERKEELIERKKEKVEKSEDK